MRCGKQIIQISKLIRMNREGIVYQENHYFYWIIIPIIAVLIFINVAYFMQLGDNPIPLTSYLLLSGLFLLILLAVYDLKVKIYPSMISISFGIGLLRKRIFIDDIDIESIKQCKIPWYYGIGLRFTPKGTVYNTNPGNGIMIRASGKNYMIETQNFEKMKEKIVHCFER